MSASLSPIARQYGPWAVVTGASDGIGRAIATRLAGQGFHLVLAARRDDALRVLAESLVAAHGIQAVALPIDLAAEGAGQALWEAVASYDVGLYVANAGFGTAGRFLDASLATECEMLAVNCATVLTSTLLFARRFADRQRGGIVLVSSILAFNGVPNQATYAATKGWVQAFAEGITPELAAVGVDVLVAAPGPTRSGFEARADLTMSGAMPADEVARDIVDALGSRGTIRPGRLTKVLSLGLSTLPRWARIRLLATISRGMTYHRDKRAPTAPLNH